MHPLPNCIMSFAGADRVGSALAKDLQKMPALASKEDLQHFLDSHAQYHRSGVTVVFGLIDRVVQMPRLLKWESNNPNTLEEDAYLFCGSGSDYLGELGRSFSLNLTHLPVGTPQKAGAFSGYFNQKLFHTIGKELALRGVGGCFFSLALDRSGLLAQQDTAIIKVEVVESEGLLIAQVIKLAYRRGILFINSPIRGDRRALLNSYNCTKEAVEAQQALARHGAKALQELGVDFDEVWDLSDVRSIEIHFDYDNIPSHFVPACDQGEFLTLDATRTKSVISEKLQSVIEDCIKKAR